MQRLWVILLALVLSAPAYSATPTDASIAELLNVMKAEQVTETMSASVDQLMQHATTTATKGQSLSAEQQRVFDARRAALANAFRNEMSWENLRPLYVEVYQQSFSQEEVDGLIAFYSSPAGIAYINKMPIVFQKTLALVQARMAPMMERMRAAIQQAADDAKAVK